MRHQRFGRTLGRNASHRLALMRNLAIAVITHGRIITTVEKAKEARVFVEKLITLAKQGTLHARRRALAKLPNEEAVAILFREIAPRFADRAGGYTRIIKRHERRLGDGGHTAYFELLQAGEQPKGNKKGKNRPSAPAPLAPAPITPPPATPPAAATQPETPPTQQSAPTS